MSAIAVVGASGHAKVVIDIIEREGKHRIAGLVDRSGEVGTIHFGYEIIGRDEDLANLVDAYSLTGAVVAIGDNWIRFQAVRAIEGNVPGFGVVTVVHPSAQIAQGATIGAGTVIMAGAVINPDSRIGRGCILNTNSSIDHDAEMGDFSSLAPNAATGGNVCIGECAAVGLGACVLEGRRVGEHSIVGAGATVLNDIPGFVVAYGTPARVVRSRAAGDRYLG